MLPQRKMWNSEQKWRIRKKKKGNGHGETSVSLSISPVSLSISPVLSHGKFLWKPSYRLSGLKSHLEKQKVFFPFYGNMKGIEMLIASE